MGESLSPLIEGPVPECEKEEEEEEEEEEDDDDGDDGVGIYSSRGKLSSWVSIKSWMKRSSGLQSNMAMKKRMMKKKEKNESNKRQNFLSFSDLPYFLGNLSLSLPPSSARIADSHENLGKERRIERHKP